MLPKEIQDAINKLPAESQLVVKAIVLIYESRIDQLEDRIKELEDQISKNSRNSSKPPSTDEFNKPSPKSLRKETGRKAGGQKGHKGNNLKMVAAPDEEQLHKVRVCGCCQKDLQKQKAIAKGKLFLSQTTLTSYRKRYDLIVQKGFEANPFKPPATKKRGRPKKTKTRNLIERFIDYADDVLRFFYDFKVPFDNNFSERDLRMMKVKQKISGCFRSLNGAKFFARIRSFIITARKQKVNVFKALSNLFIDNSIACQLTSIQLC